MSMLTELDLLGRTAVLVQLGGQRLDGLGVAPLGDEQHPALDGVGGQGDVVVTAGTRGLVDGQRVHVAEVGLRQRELDVALAHRHHPVRRLSPTMRATRGKRHLLRQHQDQRLEQQREARQLPRNSGSTRRTEPSGSFTRGVRTCRWHSCWKKFRCR